MNSLPKKKKRVRKLKQSDSPSGKNDKDSPDKEDGSTNAKTFS